jgi:hypothetical protein
MSPFVSGSSHHHSGATTIRVPSRGVQNLQLYYIRTANNNKQKTLDHLRLLPLDLCSTHSRRPPQQLRKKPGIQPGAPSLTLRSQNQPGGQSHSRRMRYKPTATAGLSIAPPPLRLQHRGASRLVIDGRKFAFPGHAWRRCRRDRTPSRNGTGAPWRRCSVWWADSPDCCDFLQSRPRSPAAFACFVRGFAF